MKTKGMQQQIEALKLMSGKEYFALLMEQGTGKTWTLLADAERLYAAGLVDSLFVLAPNGVHVNWVKREIPTHFDIAAEAVAWRPSPGIRWLEDAERRLFRPRQLGEVPPFRILTMNMESFITKKGFEFAKRFVLLTKCLFVIDESDRIKNPKSAVTKKALALRPHAAFARVSTGTPITEAPLDIFPQFEFMSEGLLGTTSYRSFVAEYADLVDVKNDWKYKKLLERTPQMQYAQVIAKDEEGRPKWKNLEKLSRLVAKHSYRVLKKECLDLPEKIYTSHYFDLTPGSRAAYELMESEFRINLENGDVTSVAALAAISKLQQITSGFIKHPFEDRIIHMDDNPRIDALMEVLEDVKGKVIIWAKFREEIENISARLKLAGRKVVEYHGGVDKDKREEAIDALQSGDAEFFVAQPKAGGIGLTLTAAETTIYYSNEFSLRIRLQSEDRNHRIGTKGDVRYIDLVANDTIDEAIMKALQWKTNLAKCIFNERQLAVPVDFELASSNTPERITTK